VKNKIIFLFCLVATLSAEEIYIPLLPDGILVTTSTTQTITDPFNGTTQPQATTPEIFNLSGGAETEVNKFAKTITVPLAYSWKNYNAGISVPYFIERSMYYKSGG